MPARTDDFARQIDQAAGLTMDATCALRAAGIGPLPHPHRHLLTRAIRSLERAQDTLHTLRNEDVWHKPPPPKPKQMALL